MQNLQRESKTPYGNQRKITVVVTFTLTLRNMVQEKAILTAYLCSR